MGNQVSIHDMDIRYGISRRDIKYPRLEFKTGGLLLVLPKNADEGEIIKKHERWICQRSRDIETALKESRKKRLDLDRTEDEFKRLVDSFVEEVARELGVNINHLYFRKMKSKWGSCSSKKNLTINTLLKYLPENLLRYVVYHETVHLVERKHNERFWGLVSSKFENHQEDEKELLVYWFLIQRRFKREEKEPFP
jgi:predicted metal-dependent hydrolase